MASQVTRVVGALCAKSGSRLPALPLELVIKSMHAPQMLPSVRPQCTASQRALNFCTTASTLDQFVAQLFVAHLKPSQVTSMQPLKCPLEVCSVPIGWCTGTTASTLTP